MDPSYLEVLVDRLMQRGVEFGPGLSDAEVARTERSFGVRLPEDLRLFLQHALPTSDDFPDWRAGPDSVIRERLAWPLEGLLFDVEHNDFWLESWGRRPSRLVDAFDITRRAVSKAPSLIPIYSHRYIPAEPELAGNPVFSVYQADIINYGNDLASYFHHEFAVPIPGWAARMPRSIRFWDELVERNSAR